LDKTWYNQGGTREYHWGSNGYINGSTSGFRISWNWINNSDTLIINMPTPPDEVLIIEWNTDTEMSCRRNTGSSLSTLFKTTKW
jgi:hypothetical protein